MKAVILAGGSGSRLWPMSRDLKPKQFHCFTGNRTMLQQTYERLSFLDPRNIFVATNEQYAHFVHAQLPRLPKEHLILEPAMRDTGPSICFSAHTLAKLGFEREVMTVVYADHLIQKSSEFEAVLRCASDHVAEGDCIGVIAVRAKSANPNLGYIKIGSLIEGKGGREIYALERFVEKPSEAHAKKFLTSYKYLWNTGLYIGSVRTFLTTFKRLAPEIFNATKSAATYGSSPKISIDYAVIEKLEQASVRVFPAELGWNDIGNWAALHEELTAHGDENIGIGNHVNLETSGSIVIGNSGRLVVTYGVKDMVIVDTEDALLVMPKEKASEVKKIVAQLSKNKKTWRLR